MKPDYKQRQRDAERAVKMRSKIITSGMPIYHPEVCPNVAALPIKVQKKYRKYLHKRFPGDRQSKYAYTLSLEEQLAAGAFNADYLEAALDQGVLKCN